MDRFGRHPLKLLRVCISRVCQCVALVDMGFSLSGSVRTPHTHRYPLLRGILRFFRPPRTQNHLSVFLMPGIGTVTRSFQPVKTPVYSYFSFEADTRIPVYYKGTIRAPYRAVPFRHRSRPLWQSTGSARHASFQNQLYLLMVVSNRFATLTGHRHNGRTVNFSRFILALSLRSARHIPLPAAG